MTAWPEARDKIMKKVTIYTTPTCGFCKMTKAFYKENNVQYNEVDVSTDQEKANEMIQKSGQMGVPVNVVTDEAGKEEIVIGFDRARLAKLLDIK